MDLNDLHHVIQYTDDKLQQNAALSRVSLSQAYQNIKATYILTSGLVIKSCHRGQDTVGLGWYNSLQRVKAL